MNKNIIRNRWIKSLQNVLFFSHSVSENFILHDSDIKYLDEIDGTLFAKDRNLIDFSMSYVKHSLLKHQDQKELSDTQR